MSSHQIIEHMVLFKIKADTDQSKIDTMISRLNGLISLDSVLHISATLILPHPNPCLPYTHILHSRHSSKENLAVYTDHPSHVSVVTESVNPICEGIMVVDWVFDDFIVPIKLQPGTAIRATFLKLKEGSEKKEKTLGVLAKLKEKMSLIDQVTYGENFSPSMTHGFSIALIFVILGVSELKSLSSRENARVKMNQRVRDLVDNILIVDFVLPDM